MSDKDIIIKAQELHPEAANEIEAVDLYALDVHNIVMKATDMETFQNLKLLFNQIRSVYRNLIKTAPAIY